MKIANKISIAFLTTTIILTTLFTSIFYIVVRNDFFKAIDTRLDAIVYLRAQHIETYLNMLKTSVGQLSKSVVLENLLKAGGEGSKGYKEALGIATGRLIRTKEAMPYIAKFLLLDRTGKVISSSYEENIGRDMSTDAIFTGGQKTLYIKDAYYSRDLKKGVMAVSGPMLDNKTMEFLGVVVAEIDLTDLYKIVTDHAGFGKTEETFIVNKYGYMITPSRFLKDTFLKYKIDTENLRSCISNRDKGGVCNLPHFIIIAPDYRGVMIAGSNAYIPETQWCLLSKIDAAEALAPLTTIRVITIIILFLAPILAWLLGIFLASPTLRPIDELRKGAEIIGTGNLDYNIAVSTKDEISELALMFNKMTVDLKGSTTSINNLNKEIAARKKAEEGLERLAAIVESSQDAIIGKSLDGTIINWNKGAEKIYGYSEGEIKGKSISILAPPDHKEEMASLLKKIREGIRIERFETIRVRKDGRIIDVSISASPVYGKNKEIVGASTIASDITRQKRIEEALRSIEERYRVLYESSADAIMVIYQNGRCFAGNPSAVKMFGFKNESEFVSYDVMQLSPERQPDGVMSTVKAKEMIDIAMKNGSHSFEWVHRRLDGNPFYASVLLTRIGLQGVYMIQATVRDITEIKKAQAEIARAAEEWQRTFDSMSDIVFIMDLDSHIVKVNKAFTDKLGKALGDVIGKKCYEVIHKGTAHWPSCPLVGTYDDRTAHTEEVDDPSIGIPLLVTTSPLLDDKGKMIGVVHVAKDITEIKKAEKAMKEAIDIKEQFISIASHELRAPMGIIKESVEIISDETAGKVGAQVTKFIDMARRNVERLVRLSNNLLDFQKLSLGKFEFNIAEHDINKTVKEAAIDMAMLAKDKGLEFSINLAEGLPLVKFDKDAITEVVTNLLSNAVKFTEKGRITVSSERSSEGVVVSVSDTGPGISEENIAKLFQPFHQIRTAGEKKGGTGLGLAISRAIVDQHKGRMWAESKAGSGATLRFFLPSG